MKPDEVAAASEVMCACYRRIGAKSAYNDEQIAYLVGERGAKQTVEKESKNQTFLVACEGEKVVGVAAVNGSELAKLFVTPGRQGQGIGSRLFHAAEEVVKRTGNDEMIVGVMFEDAVGFYEKLGMTQFGTKLPDGGVFRGFEVKLMRKKL
jgi:GNAT superfamily N-acetyltransferase